MQERLQKLISRAGVASRRHAEQLIVSGHVTVNGHVITELGSKADPEADHIKVGGKLLRFSQARIYLALHKPAGCVATMSDTEGRQSLSDFLHGVPGRVFPAGRLDFHSEGLLLLTNDGDLVNRLLKVSGRLQQVYWIKVKGPLSAGVLHQVQSEVGARLAPLKARSDAPNPWYEATVTEAKSDALRQNLSRLGHHVEKLRRVKLAELELGDVEAGTYRMLAEGEVAALIRAVARTEQLGSAKAAAPIPYRGAESASAKPRASRPRPGGPARFRSERPAAAQQRPGKQWSKPGGASSSTATGPRTGRGKRPGGARPSTPREFPSKRWSRPGGAPAGPSRGPGASHGGTRPFSPRPYPKKQWSRPGGASSRASSSTAAGPSSGPGERPGGARPFSPRSSGPPRTFSGKPSGKPPGKPWGKPSGEKPKWKGGSKGPRGPRNRSGKPGNYKRTDRG